MTPKLKKIIIMIIIIIVLFVIYAVFVKSNPQINPLLKGGDDTQSQSVSAEEAQALGNQISQALLRIEKIKLDKAVFSDQIYKTLIDRSRPIEDERMGRKNPFAPIGDISFGTTVRSTSTAPITSTVPITTTASTTATTSQQI